MFVMDESGSITQSNFLVVKQFVIDVVGDFQLSQNGVRVGVIKYNSDATVCFCLNERSSCTTCILI